MNVAKFCIKHRVTTLMAVIMITIFGSVFTTRLQMSLLPNMSYPAAYVFCYYNGATPSDMEELVTRPLEAAIMSVPGVDSIQSSSADSTSTVQISYVDGTDVDIAAAKLREQFDALSLPDGCTSPTIMNLNISDMMPTAIITLMGDDLAQVQTLAEDTVGPALERIDGVASVSISGGVSQQVTVEVDAARAAGMGLSNSYIAQMMAAENLLYPGGTIHNGSQTLTVSTDAKFRSVSDVANMILPLPTGGTIRLNEVAKVYLETGERESISNMDGTSCVILQVSKQSGANETATAKAVEKAMANLREKNHAVVYGVPYLASTYIDMAVTSALENIVLGVLLATVVVFLFLRRFGATAAIAVSMPVCILTVFVLMNVFDLTLNMMSLGGIAMGVGMIVDNSIVVLENIYRYVDMGHSRMESCVEGTREVITSLMASTLTTVAVFFPLGLSGGLAGMIFKDFCLTIAFLILSSLAIAVTLVPLLCYLMLDEQQMQRRREGADKGSGLARRALAWYEKTLGYFLRHLGQGMAVSLALVMVFTVACLSTKMVLLPEMDQGMVAINVSMPIGSKVNQTQAITQKVVDVMLREVPELDNYYYTSQNESASITMNLVGRSDRQRTSNQVANDLRACLQDNPIPGCEISITASDMTAMMSGDDIRVNISGTDYDTLALIAQDLSDQIGSLEDAVDVSSTLAVQVPQVTVSMKREAASQYGLNAAAVGAAIRAELTGSTATSVTINNKALDVVIRGDGAAKESLDALGSMAVSTPYGISVPLSSVADVRVEQAPRSITRTNQARQIAVVGSTVSGDVSAMTEQIRAILDSYTLPDGYTASIGGAYTEMTENFSDLLLALVIAIGLVYFVLASQFESFIMPVIVMLILPVAFTGALFALPMTGRDLSMISLVALIMLAGTVVNASIILVDYIRQRREMGESREQAILHACPLRIRPVMMTTMTTILALIPMAMGIGDLNEMMSDMGIVMIFGMVISTVITLLFTPVYYSVIDNLSQKVSGLFRRRRTLPAE